MQASFPLARPSRSLDTSGRRIDAPVSSHACKETAIMKFLNIRSRPHRRRLRQRRRRDGLLRRGRRRNDATATREEALDALSRQPIRRRPRPRGAVDRKESHAREARTKAPTRCAAAATRSPRRLGAPLTRRPRTARRLGHKTAQKARDVTAQVDAKMPRRRSRASTRRHQPRRGEHEVADGGVERHRQVSAHARAVSRLGRWRRVPRRSAARLAAARGDRLARRRRAGRPASARA